MSQTPREINDAFRAERRRLGRPLTAEEIQTLDASLAAAASRRRALSGLEELEEPPPGPLTLLESWQTFARNVLPPETPPAMRNKAQLAYHLGVLDVMERLEVGADQAALYALHVERLALMRSLADQAGFAETSPTNPAQVGPPL